MCKRRSPGVAIAIIYVFGGVGGVFWFAKQLQGGTQRVEFTGEVIDLAAVCKRLQPAWERELVLSKQMPSKRIFISSGTYSPKMMLACLEWVCSAKVRTIGKVDLILPHKAIPKSPYAAIDENLFSALKKATSLKLVPDSILQKERIPFNWSLFRDEKTLTASELNKQQKVFLLALCFLYADLRRKSPPNSLYLWSTDLDSINDMVTRAINSCSDADIEKYMSLSGLKTASIYFRFPIFRLSLATYKPVNRKGTNILQAQPGLLWFLPQP